MKIKERFIPTLLFAFFLLTTFSCQKSDDLSPTIADEVTTEQDAILQDLAQKLSPEKRQTFLAAERSRVSARAPITYVQQLCPDEAVTGNLPIDGEEYYTFFGEAGASVTITVTRIDCGLDPALYVWDGTAANTNDLSIIASADDETAKPASCAAACFAFFDPTEVLVLPYTGFYTLEVWEFISGSCYSDGAYTVTIENVICNVVIDGCDSGVRDMVLDDGNTITDLINDCAAAATNHGDFVSCVAHLTNQLKQDGLISGEEKGAIQSCAAGANIP